MSDATEKAPTSLDDIFKDEMFLEMFDDFDNAGIMLTDEGNQLKYGGHYDLSSRKPYDQSEGELTAKQEKCADFDKYKAEIDQVQSDMANHGYSQTRKTECDITTGNAFVSNGLMGVIVAINDSEKRNSGQTKRAHVVYSNGTESHPLLSSIVATTYKPNSYFIEIIK